MENNKLYFAKTKEKAIIPTKRVEDAGYDLYPCFDEDYLVIPPLETVLVPTGVATAMSDNYYAQIQERGSTGSKGIKYGAGVIDSGYRGEWFVPITNVNDKYLIITKKPLEELGKKNILETVLTIPYGKGNFACIKIEEDKTPVNAIIYPYEKAIAQFVVLPVPKMETETISYEELLNFKSDRGTDALGSSNK